MKKKRTLQPLEMVNFLTSADSEIWNQLCNEQGQVNAILCKEYADKHYPDTAGMLYALALWRQHKMIYEFDREISKLLKDIGTIDDDIPCEAIMHMPYNGIYIQLPDKLFWFNDRAQGPLGQIKEEIIHVEGFFFSLDTLSKEAFKQSYTAVNGGDISECATFAMLFDNGKMMSLAIPLSGKFTLKTGFEMMGNGDFSKNNSVIQLCSELLQLVLYLSAVNADIEEDAEQKELRERNAKKEEMHEAEPNQPAQSKKQETSYRELQKWNVGYRYGAAVKKTVQAERKNHSNKANTSDAHYGSHARKRTHARRGHFHHFWTGSKTGERQLILKWVSPVIVNAEYENIVTIRKVKSYDAEEKK